MFRNHTPSGFDFRIGTLMPVVIDPGVDEDERRRNCTRAIQHDLAGAVAFLGFVGVIVLVRTPIIAGPVSLVALAPAIWLWITGPERRLVPRAVSKDLARLRRAAAAGPDRAVLHRSVWAQAEAALVEVEHSDAESAGPRALGVLAVVFVVMVVLPAGWLFLAY